MDGEVWVLERPARQLRSVCEFPTINTTKSSRYVEIVPRGLGIMVRGDEGVRGYSCCSCLRRRRLIRAPVATRHGLLVFLLVRSLPFVTGILFSLINEWEMMNP
ncbi:hypothetical protein AAC387_Pa01g2887 [Persea americana]